MRRAMSSLPRFSGPQNHLAKRPVRLVSAPGRCKRGTPFRRGAVGYALRREVVGPNARPVMSDLRRFSLVDLVLFLAVLAVAAGCRTAYLSLAAANGTTAGPIEVQDAQPPLTGLPPGTVLRGHE